MHVSYIKFRRCIRRRQGSQKLKDAGAPYLEVGRGWPHKTRYSPPVLSRQIW